MRGTKPHRPSSEILARLNLPPKAFIFFMGICGTGMGSLAQLLKSKGFRVEGCDQGIYPPMSTQLQKAQIPIYEGYDPAKIVEQPDLWICGNALNRTNPLVEYMLHSAIPYLSFPEALRYFAIQNRDSIVISGTHGKTTTTALLAFALEKLGATPSYLIGGVPKDLASSQKFTTDGPIVIEGDEYDTAFFDKESKFLHYDPTELVITSIEYDHADIYEDVEEIKESFQKLIMVSKRLKTIIACYDQPHVRDSLKRCEQKFNQEGRKFPNVIWYGTNAKADLYLKNYQFDTQSQKSTFQIELGPELAQNWGQAAVKGELLLGGQYNVLNAITALAICVCRGYSVSQAVSTIKLFAGVKRRQDVFLQTPQVVMIDDFAHHPSAVKVTLKAIREKYPTDYVIGVFEPRTATSGKNTLQKDYVDAFTNADEAIVTIAYKASYWKPEERFDSMQLVTDIQNSTRQKAQCFANAGEIVQYLTRFYSEFKANNSPKRMVVCLMSNGGFEGIYQKLIDAFSP